MDDELAMIASAGATALSTAMVADAWRAIRTGIAGAFRLVFRRRGTGASRGLAAEPARQADRGSPAGSPATAPATATARAPATAGRGSYEQTNLALGGHVFAVQHGDMTVRLPADKRGRARHG